jgi:hypothetical protein
MKKSLLVLFVLGLFAVFLLSDFVSAGFGEDLIDTLSGAVSGIADPIIKFTEQTVAFTKTLFFILVFLIIVTLLGTIPLFSERKGMSILVAIIVSILAVFFIPTDLILPMLNPYSALGIGIISVLPFILMFLFVHNMIENHFLRSIAWMFFAVGLLGMTVYTSLLQSTDPSQYGNPLFSWIYGIASILALIMVFINERIDKAIWKGKLEGGVEQAERRLDKRLALDKLKEKEADAQGLG